MLSNVQSQYVNKQTMSLSFSIDLSLYDESFNAINVSVVNGDGTTFAQVFFLNFSNSLLFL